MYAVASTDVFSLYLKTETASETSSENYCLSRQWTWWPSIKHKHLARNGPGYLSERTGQGWVAWVGWHLQGNDYFPKLLLDATRLFLGALPRGINRSSQVKVTLRLTVSQSVSLGVEPHLGLMSCYFLLFASFVFFFFCGAPSLTRGRVCLLYMLLALASAVFLGFESLGTRDHILLSQTWDFPFRRLLRLAGSPV
jgi:hypothetical protein